MRIFKLHNFSSKIICYKKSSYVCVSVHSFPELLLINMEIYYVVKKIVMLYLVSNFFCKKWLHSHTMAPIVQILFEKVFSQFCEHSCNFCWLILHTFTIKNIAILFRKIYQLILRLRKFCRIFHST